MSDTFTFWQNNPYMENQIVGVNYMTRSVLVWIGLFFEAFGERSETDWTDKQPHIMIISPFIVTEVCNHMWRVHMELRHKFYANCVHAEEHDFRKE